MKKKILILVDWYEPGYKAGGPVQSCRNFVLAMKDIFDLFIITSDRDLGDEQPYIDIIFDSWITKNGNVKVYYTDEKKLSGGKLLALYNFVDPDYIYLNSMYSYHFTILPLWQKMGKKIKAKIIIAPRGMLQQGAMQFKSFKKKFFIQLMNFTSVPRQLIFHATDEQEKKDIYNYFPSAGSISVIPNFPRLKFLPWESISKQPGNLRCVFISRMAPKKNILFLLQVFQQLPATTKLHLSIRGEIEDSAYWKKCIAVINTLPKNISVQWDGAVNNDDVTAVLQQHHIFVLPTKGENFGHAIFEALAAGKPVLISDQTPWRGLKIKKTGWDLPLDQPALFLEAIEQAICFGQDEYDTWSHHAWQYAQDYAHGLNLTEGYLKLFS